MARYLIVMVFRFCSVGTEFDSPYEMYVVHVWQLLYRVRAGVVYLLVQNCLINIFKICFEKV